MLPLTDTRPLAPSASNATELIVSVFALNNGLIQVVQVSLLGSILSNLLLVMGCSFITAGIRWKLVKFNTLATSSNMSLLLLACLSIIVPGMLESLHDISDANELHLSRLIAVLLLVIYVVFVYFQLVSHHSLFEEEEEEEDNEEEGGAIKEDEDEDEEAILTMSCAVCSGVTKIPRPNPPLTLPTDRPHPCGVPCSFSGLP